MGIVTRGPVERIDVLSTWGGNGGGIVSELFQEDFSDGHIVSATTGDRRLTLTLPTNPSSRWTAVKPGCVLRVLRRGSTGLLTWEEFEAQEIGDAQRSGVTTLAGIGFLGALADIGLVEQVDADGTALSTFDAPGLDPATHITDYIVQTCIDNGLTCVECGVVDFDVPLPNFSYAGDSPFTALQKLATAVQGEYRARWNPGTSKYAIDLRSLLGDYNTDTGADDAGPFGEARAYVNAEIDRTRTRLTQANVIYPVGEAGANPGDADWVVVSIT